MIRQKRKCFRVTAKRSRYFPTLEAAKAYCELYFRRTGIVLGIVEVNR